MHTRVLLPSNSNSLLFTTALLLNHFSWLAWRMKSAIPVTTTTMPSSRWRPSPRTPGAMTMTYRTICMLSLPLTLIYVWSLLSQLIFQIGTTLWSFICIFVVSIYFHPKCIEASKLTRSKPLHHKNSTERQLMMSWHISLWCIKTSAPWHGTRIKIIWKK